MTIIIFFLLYTDFKIPLLLTLFAVNFVAVKLKNYKSYGITIVLKSGAFLKQKIPLKLKYEAINFVNKIRNEIFILSATS